MRIHVSANVIDVVGNLEKIVDEVPWHLGTTSSCEIPGDVQDQTIWNGLGTLIPISVGLII